MLGWLVTHELYLWNVAIEGTHCSWDYGDDILTLPMEVTIVACSLPSHVGEDFKIVEQKQKSEMEMSQNFFVLNFDEFVSVITRMNT